MALPAQLRDALHDYLLHGHADAAHLPPDLQREKLVHDVVRELYDFTKFNLPASERASLGKVSDAAEEHLDRARQRWVGAAAAATTTAAAPTAVESRQHVAEQMIRRLVDDIDHSTDDVERVAVDWSGASYGLDLSAEPRHEPVSEVAVLGVGRATVDRALSASVATAGESE